MTGMLKTLHITLVEEIISEAVLIAHSDTRVRTDYRRSAHGAKRPLLCIEQKPVQCGWD